MGLDLALGMVILFSAIRGWLRGFVSQAVRMAGFVACFYLADPIRDQARPYVLARLPKVDPALLDRMTWWAAAVASYIVLVGTCTLAIKLTRRPDASGNSETRRDNQFAGFLFGAARGAIIASFLAAGVQKYGIDATTRPEWVTQQCGGSKALDWNRQYQPAPRLWASQPVQKFVEHIRRNGMGAPVSPSSEPAPAEEPDAVAAARDDQPAPREQPRLEIPVPRAADPSLDLDPDFVAEVERFRSERDARRRDRDEGDWR